MNLQTHVEKTLCEQEHLYFTRRFFKPRMGFKFIVNWHHEYVAWLIDEVVKGNIANLVINVPPGAGKTELTTNLIARGIGLNPRSRFLYLSYSQSLVEDVSSTARNIVKSDDFQQMWKTNISTSTDAKASWKTTVDGYEAGHIYAASMGGQVTGRRAGTLADDGFTGCIILDDPLKPEDAFSKPARDKANRKILNTVNSRKAKSDTPIIMIMQRLHSEDPTNFVMSGNVPGDWAQVSIPALIDDEYIQSLPNHIQMLVPRNVERDEKGRQSYWPQKESLNSLLQLEKGGKDKDGAIVSRYTFGSQYQQQPKKLGGDLIKAEWFGYYKELPPLQWRAIYVDTAQKTKEHNDYTVFLLVGLGIDGKLYLIDLLRGKWEALIRHIDDPFWTLYYPPWDFMCRCHVIALTKKQAEKYGITSDEDLPEVARNLGWSFNPATWGSNLNEVLDQKIADNLLNLPYSSEILDIKNAALLEQDVEKAIVDAFKPLEQSNRKILDDFLDTVIDSGKDIAPSAPRFVVELVTEDENLTELLKDAVTKKGIDRKSKSIWDWMNDSFQSMLGFAKNLKNKLTGNNIKGFDSFNLQKGNVIGIQTPTLFKTAENAGKTITILDMKGHAIDLTKIQGLDGYLLASDLNLEVIDITDSEVILKKTAERANRMFIANSTLYVI